MGFNLTIRSSIIIIISILVLLLGISLILLLNNVGKDILSLQLQSDISHVEVIPESSQKGTIFLIKAVIDKKESQDYEIIIENDDSSHSVYLYDDGKHYDREAGDGYYGGFLDSTRLDYGKYDIKANDHIKTLSKLTVSGKDCERLVGNKDSLINFVILPSGYDSYEDFKIDANKLLSGTDSIIGIEPFKSNLDKFSFTLLNTTKDLGCEVGCYGVSTAVCCIDKKVEIEATKCDADSVIVLVNEDSLCGSASSYAKICAKNPSAKVGLIHEVGHSFADLADEYVYSDYYGDYDIGKIDSVNCDESGCDSWSDVTDGCYKGCSYSNLFRPSFNNSVMYDLVPSFNIVCQNEILDLVSEIQDSKADFRKSFIVRLEANEEDLMIKDAFIKPINTPVQTKESLYKAVIKDSENNKIHETNVYIPDKMFLLPGPDSRLIIKDSTEFLIFLPYQTDAKSLEIYKNNELIAGERLDILVNKCGNNICDETENHKSCSTDCELKDNFCETSICDPDCESQKYCLITSKLKIIVPILLVLISALIIAYIIIVAYKKSKK